MGVFVPPNTGAAAACHRFHASNGQTGTTIWLFNIAMETMALIEIDGLPIRSYESSMVILTMANS